jgi:asparaginyl-tRNA synthetase
MSALSKEDAKKLFEAANLDAKRVLDTLKNEKLTEALAQCFSWAGVTTEKGCDKSTGNLLYSVSTEYPSKAAGDHKKVICEYINKKSIVSKQQLLGAFKFCTTNATFDANTFEADAGVGIVVSPEQIETFVNQVVAKNPQANLGEIMRECKGDSLMQWADPIVLRPIVEKKAKKPEPVKKEKKVAKPVANKEENTNEPTELTEDASLPSATRLELRDLAVKADEFVGKRVRVFGWTHFVRDARKDLIFVVLRDGTGFVQCVISGKKLCVPNLTSKLLRECSLEIVGVPAKLPQGHFPPEGANSAPVELHVDYYRIVGESDIDLEALVHHESEIKTKFDQRHIVLRGARTSALIQMRSVCCQLFREYYYSHSFTEVTPPTIVQTQCEGGSDLFKLDYFGEDAYLTQSSQLYLETVLPVVGKTFCLLPSYRAEQSRTPRHLSEFTHMEAELPFITFEDLLAHLEDLICTFAENLLNRFGPLVKFCNPDFKVPERPFKRMRYSDAIAFCNANGILNQETGKPFQSGEDITEKPEREMVNLIGRPVFMTHFPAAMKAFYMYRTDGSTDLTDSVDLLMPGVGEIVGGSMRMHDYKELMAQYDHVKIPAAPYYWYTEQRKYGTCPHGGYGLGVERLIMWVTKDDHIRNMCLYPRYVGRATP